ncbi:hypothetical protein SAMN05421689_1552 [Leptospira interrogans]|nr:hypothetical protein SAMN05421689_1552 [Leptospira interrogans]
MIFNEISYLYIILSEVPYRLIQVKKSDELT